MNHLVPKARMKAYLLERIKVAHPVGARFTRVSEQAYTDLDYRIKNAIDGYLRAQKTGKTITTP
jgi:anti-sigma factor RsiW